MSELMGRELILAAFEKLDSELARRRLRADLFVVGGAAIALAHRRDRRTRDVDAVFEKPAEVYEVARAVAKRMHLPSDWLNDAVRSYMLGEDAAARPTYEGKALQVSVASPGYLLAMKLLAARVEQDASDIKLLYGLCGYSTPREGAALLESYLPGRPLPEETGALHEALFGASE